MSNFSAYPKIGQFRNVIKSLILRTQYAGQDEDDRPIYDTDKELPFVVFRGTTKLHGTSSGVGHSATGEIWFQSRNRVITPEDDNAGFARTFSEDDRPAFLQGFFMHLRREMMINTAHDLVLFGEWCGQGIMKGDAVCSVAKKRFVIFELKEITPEGEDNVYHTVDHFWRRDHVGNPDPDSHPTIGGVEMPIANIHDYGGYGFTLDLANPEGAVKDIDQLTNDVDARCPYGQWHGVDGRGEGIVWRASSSDVTFGTTRSGESPDDDTVYRFKSKGANHSESESSGKKQKTSVAPEKLESIEKFVEYAVTERRLEQGWGELGENPSQKDTGKFIGWMSKDINDEESDVLEESGLTMKEVGGTVANAVRQWFFAKLNAEVGL